MTPIARKLAVACAAVLLMAAALAPRLRADAAREAVPAWPTYSTCTLPVVDTDWDTTIVLPPYGAIAQPIPFTSNIAACSLKVNPSYTFGRLDLVQWDANAVLQDPTTVALRSVALNSSNMAWNWLHVAMSPPVVTRAIAHVADPPVAQGAMTYTGTYAYNTTAFRYRKDGLATMPTGYHGGGTSWQALPGPHAVHGVSVCGGDGALQELRVAQSVMRTDVTLPYGVYDVLQRFRVPRTVRMHWIEVAADSTTNEYYRIGAVELLRDGMGASPPLELPPALVSASLWHTGPLPAWASHFDFDSSVVLSPGVDYWLRVTPAHYYKLRAHAVSGAEGPDFAAGIGPMWTRAQNGDPWTLESARALSFRVIGDTANVVGVTPAPVRAPFEVRATPNPARGASVFAWAGADRGVRLDVLDARGRRVGGVTHAPGASGSWAWTAANSGRPLAPGLYFVRATDALGRRASARVVIVR